jgi:hypothetical protein
MTRFPSRTCPYVLIDHYGDVTPIWLALEGEGAPFSGPTIYWDPVSRDSRFVTSCFHLCEVIPPAVGERGDWLPDGMYTITCFIGRQRVGGQIFHIGPGPDN